MLKYKKRKVMSLSDQALVTFGTHLVTSLNYQIKQKAHEGLVTKEIKEYMDAVGADTRVRQDLLDFIAGTRHPAVRSAVRCVCFAILMDESTSAFGKHLYWDSCSRRIWKMMAQQSANLRNLDLKNTHLATDEMRYFKKILRRNTKLERLTLPCAVQKDETREFIDKYCKNLRYLSLPEHDRIMADAEFLSRSNVARTLTQIDFNLSSNLDLGIHTRAIAQILRSCPRIEMFKNYAHVGAALKICHEYDAEFKCNLRMLRDTQTSRTVMKTIVETCPKLKLLHLTAPESGSLKALEKAALEELTHEGSFIASELIALLSAIGKHLFGLVLRDSSVSLDICEIRKNCPLLAKLEVEYLSNMQADQMAGMFEHLQELRIYMSTLSTSVLTTLMYSAQNLQTFQIDKVNFDDEWMRSVFTRCNFKNLKEFKIGYAPKLTVQSIKLLLDCCPNLETLGCLGGWNLSSERLKSIKSLQVVDGPEVQLRNNYVPHGSLLLLLR